MNDMPQAPSLSAMTNPLQWIETVGPIISASRMFGCDNVAQGKVLASMQVTHGLPLMEIMRTYHFVDGKLTMRAEAMLAKFRDQYGGKHTVLRRDPEQAAIRLVDRHGVSTDCSLSWEQIKDEPFTKDKKGGIKTNYATPHKRMQMLWARLVSDAIRSVEPGVVAGAYTPEEVAEFTFGGEASLPEEAPQEQPETTTQLMAPEDEKPVYSWRESDPASPDTIANIRNLISEVSQHDPGIVDKLKQVLAGMGKKLDQLTHGEAQAMQSKLQAKLNQSQV